MRLVPLATLLSLACPSTRLPHSSDDTAGRVRVAQLEARRGASIGELVERARRGDRLAIRALGRIGGDQARAVLVELLARRDPNDVAAAAEAIGVATSLDGEDDPGAPARRAAMSRELLGALARATSHRDAIVEAIGRAGDPADASAVLAELLANLSSDPDLAKQAAFAFARFSRRKLAWAAGRVALVGAARGPDPEVRYAATYALAREFQPAHDDTVDAALAAGVADDEPEVRATALTGLLRRKAVAAHQPEVAAALGDRDWRVAVEAVHALATDDAGRDAIAGSLVARARRIDADPPQAHVVLEALRALAGHADHAAVETALDEVPSVTAKLPPITRAWIDCLIASARRDLGRVGTCALPDHLRAAVVADTLADKTPPERAAVAAAMLQHGDARVRAAAFDLLAGVWGEAGVDPQQILEPIAAAIDTGDVIVGGSAVDAAGALLGKIAATDPAHELLARAIVKRAATESDPEFEASILQIIGERALDADACRAGLTKHRVIAAAAAACMRARSLPVPTSPPAAAEPPPVDVASVIGKRVHWHLITSRGPITIALEPDVAPWAVATIVQLTRAHHYDHLAFHRVVPDFVVQGGDPTETGAGGPGFTLPAEPGTLLDGAGFVAGGIGLADAGADSAGSQYFAMHSRAAHLDGRYTWVGAIVSGQNTADSLLIGDAVLSATIVVEP